MNDLTNLFSSFLTYLLAYLRIHLQRQHPELGFVIPEWVTPDVEQWFYDRWNQGSADFYVPQTMYLGMGELST